MYIILMGCSQQGAVQPLAASIDPATLVDLADASGPASGSIVAFTTNPTELEAVCIASGGTGSYTFSWAVSKTSETSDNNNRFSVASAGTTNVAVYDDLTITGARPALGGQVFTGEFSAVCTVDDGLNQVTASTTFRVQAAAF